ncbi:MoxR-like ATPase [Bradyrhizobium sp. USDA 4518]
MLIPHIYGLGDLSQILGHRAYDQAQEILSAPGDDDMNKFVMTDAFRAAARAIVERSFVLFLGEPACGKSAIAAALALALWTNGTALQ